MREQARMKRGSSRLRGKRQLDLGHSKIRIIRIAVKISCFVLGCLQAQKRYTCMRKWVYNDRKSNLEFSLLYTLVMFGRLGVLVLIER